MPRIVLMAILLTGVPLLGQLVPEDAPPMQTTPAATATTSAPPPNTSPAASAAVVQQRVLKYDPSHPVPPEQRRAGENDPLTLHLLLGRSLFINTADRMRRVYVSNPAVLVATVDS